MHLWNLKRQISLMSILELLISIVRVKIYFGARRMWLIELFMTAVARARRIMQYVRNTMRKSTMFISCIIDGSLKLDP